MRSHIRESPIIDGLRVAAAVAGCALLSMPVDVAAQADDALLKTVIVSRHGVRTPTIAGAELALWAAQPWPEWKEPRGNLTTRGGELAVLLGKYYREQYSAQGLLPANGCPAASSAYVYADLTQRTKATAQGLIDGLAPGCGIALDSKTTPGDFDGIFHPIEAGVCRIDVMQAQTSVLERVGGNFSRVAAEHRDAFAALQSTLGCCKPALCAAFGRAEGCTLPSLPNAAVQDEEGIGMIGALSIASAASELFLLEYADGKPAADVAWGKATPDQIRQMLALHDVGFDLTERTPYLARRIGSSLLARVASTLTGLSVGGVPVPDAPIRAAKFVAYVGHDTNLANLGGMLAMHWALPDYQLDETPPAGALVFELRAGADGKTRVYTSFLAQAPDQMRNATPLTLAAPPLRVPVRIPACSNDLPGFPCLAEGFLQAVRGAIDANCIDTTPWTTMRAKAGGMK